MSALLLAVDLGTESVRACVVSADGMILRSARRGFVLHSPRPGWAEQDPADWWAATVETVREVLNGGPVGGQDIRGIGVCGQMHGPVPLAHDGSLLTGPVQLWCDKRAADQVRTAAGLPDAARWAAAAGNPPTPAWMGFKIRWEKLHRPDRYARAWKFLPPKDFLNYCFTGVPATDYSEASGSFLMDAGRRVWSDTLAAALDVEVTVLPEIRPAAEVIGTVTAEAAAETGLAAGTPVVTGGGDMLCLLLGAGITAFGRACDTTGTASVLSVYSPTPVADPRVMNLHHVTPGWIAFGICDSGGGALKWWKDLLFADGEAPPDAYEHLDRSAGAEPAGGGGLLFFPYLLGERTLGSPYARGVLFGLTPGHGRGAISRAIMEGVTLELRRALELVKSTGLDVREMRTIGGGSRSPLWSAIKADVYRLPVRTFAVFEGGLLGAAILAGTGVGLYTDAAAAADALVRLDRTYLPTANADRYDRLFALFTQTHDLLQPGFDLLRAGDQE